MVASQSEIPIHQQRLPKLRTSLAMLVINLANIRTAPGEAERLLRANSYSPDESENAVVKYYKLRAAIAEVES